MSGTISAVSGCSKCCVGVHKSIVTGKERCVEGEFRCEAEGACIPEGWQCDGHSDCKDGLDETTCSKLVQRDKVGTQHFVCRCDL